VIRRASLADLESLLPLVQGYRTFYKHPANAQAERRFIEKHLREGTSTIYIAEVQGHAAGFMQLFKTYSTVHLANAWILEDLFVAPQFRRRGIAEALLSAALKHARDDGASSMFLETAYDNETAQRVYERAGWTREERFYKYNAPLG
jgi:ribosomal protein S18 acetylase RimI-like enzyme